MRGLALLLGLALAGPARAQDSVGIALLGREVVVPMPFQGRAGAAPDHRAADARAAIAEWVPPGQSLRDWTQMLTLTARRHTPGPAAAIDALEGRYRAGCAVAPVRRDLDAGDPARRAVVLFCGQVRGLAVAEGMAALAVVAGEVEFTLQWAERAAAGGKYSLAQRPWAARLAILDDARF